MPLYERNNRVTETEQENDVQLPPRCYRLLLSSDVFRRRPSNRTRGDRSMNPVRARAQQSFHYRSMTVVLVAATFIVRPAGVTRHAVVR